MIRLIIVENDVAEARYFTSERITMGRDVGSSVRIASKAASRRHCQVEQLPGAVKVVDLNSQNGTRVNGQRVTQKKLKEGDRIEIGRAVIYFQEAPDEVLKIVPELQDKNLDRLKRERADIEGRLAKFLEEAEQKLGPEGLRVVERETQTFLDERELSYYRKLEERYSRLLKLQGIVAAINSERDPGKLMTLILDAAIEITSAERGFLITKDEQGELHFSGARNFDREFVKKPIYKISRSIAEQVMVSGDPVLTSDAQIDDRFSSYLSVADLHLCSVLVLPIKVGTDVHGVFYLDNRFAHGVFSDEDFDILISFAQQAGIAMITSRLIEENIQRARALEASKGDVDRLNQALSQEVERQKQELESLSETARTRTEGERTFKFDYSRIIGRSPAMEEVFALLDKVIPSDMPVLIQGASGTGKELIARAIHDNSHRKNKNYVSENCAAIPESLLESELFGFKKGSFTGADRDKSGLFLEAHLGTLFLDEIGDTSTQMQKKLLRALQEGEIRPVGGKQVVNVDVRIISASNKDLRKLVEDGSFREDLLYRLNVITLKVPDLRDRKEDIPLLVDHFIEKMAVSTGKPKVRVSKEAMIFFLHHDWPGNVRELENEIQKAVTLSDGIIMPEVLSEGIRPKGGPPGTKTSTSAYGAGTMKEIVKREVERVETEVILDALSKSKWNKSETARVLGVSRPTLDSKISAYGLKRED